MHIVHEVPNSSIVCGGNCTRVVFRRGGAKIGRMAALKSYRGQGVGTKLLERAIAASKRKRARRIFLHAQVVVIGSYQTAGFRAVGPLFDEAGIAHCKMTWTKRPPTR